MITHENIEIVHHFLQVAKAPFKEMLMQLLLQQGLKRFCHQ